MPAYVKLNSEEQKIMKKTVLEALSSGIKAQHNASYLLKLKRSKKLTMSGMAAALDKINEELGKLKQALHGSEFPKLKTKDRFLEIKRKSKGKTNYESELHKIKERISRLG